MRHRTLLSVLCLTSITWPALGRQEEARPRPVPGGSSGGELAADQACFDVRHYALRLRVDPAKRRIDGSLTMRATATARAESFALDLHDSLEVASVSADGEPLDFTHQDGRIAIDAADLFDELGRDFEVRVDYGGLPRVAPRAPWDGGFTWAATADGSPWVATSCQGEGADLWWPCKDHPSDECDSMDLWISVPDPLIVASNGRLVSVERDPEPGWSTHHWHVSTPINNYGVALNIAPYRAISENYESVTGDVFPITYWVLPENYEKGLEFFPQLGHQLRFFEETFGPYAFRADKYGVAETPHLGMEHQTIIAYGNRYVGNPWGKQWGFDFLHHHEAAHEWWANLVTARDWKDFWIHESLGTYAQSLYVESLHGHEAYLYEIHNMRPLRNQAAVAPRIARATNQMYFNRVEPGPDSDIYFKGAFVLHSLRWVMGEEPFRRALRRFAYPDPALEASSDGSACRLTDTEEIRSIAEEIHGAGLGWFFEVYLRQPALPILKSTVRRDIEGLGGLLLLEWELPDGLDFPMPIEVQVGDERYRVPFVDGRAAFVFDGQADPVIDPDGWVLRAEMPLRLKRSRGDGR